MNRSSTLQLNNGITIVSTIARKRSRQDTICNTALDLHFSILRCAIPILFALFRHFVFKKEEKKPSHSLGVSCWLFLESPFELRLFAWFVGFRTTTFLNTPGFLHVFGSAWSQAGTPFLFSTFG